MTETFNERRPQLVVLHGTGLPFKESLSILGGAEHDVSAHYLISQKGHIETIVADNKRAWHAGQSMWRGITDINSISIGIELEAAVDEEIVVSPDKPAEKIFDHANYTEEQIDALIQLLDKIAQRFPSLSQKNIVGHQGIAPHRKFDPGPRFPWKILASAGWGLWFLESIEANNNGVSEADISQWRGCLWQIGFNTDVEHEALLKAFRDHYCPEWKEESITQYDCDIALDLASQVNA